jgi:hypothetical protein
MCNRRGYWARRWEKHRMTSTDLVRRAVSAALLEKDRDDYGESAGEELVTLASDRGLDAEGINLYRSVMNHAAIADLVASAIRKPNTPPWLQVHTKGSSWNYSALLDPSGTTLRRFLPVSSWNEDRKEHEVRSWFGIGEVCMLEMPMQMIVAQMGPMSGGRRHGFWSKALLHPQKSSLRFKKRSRGTIEGFKETWIPVFREEHDEIDRHTWLQAMFEDDVLQESLFVVEIPLPGELEAGRIRDMAKRKLDIVRRVTELPDKQLSTCDGPLAPCPFRDCCWGQPESAPAIEIFDAVS